MSKFFMYGTELQDIEQMMMLVPNFIPRRSGVAVVKKLEYENEGVTCHDCDRYKHSRCHDNTLSCFAEKVVDCQVKLTPFPDFLHLILTPFGQCI